MNARADLERLAAQLGNDRRVEQHDDGLWLVRNDNVPVAFMPAAESTQSGEPARLRKAMMALAAAVAAAVLFAPVAHAECGVVIHCVPTPGGRGGGGTFCKPTTLPPCPKWIRPPDPPAEDRPTP